MESSPAEPPATRPEAFGSMTAPWRQGTEYHVSSVIGAALKAPAHSALWWCGPDETIASAQVSHSKMVEGGTVKARVVAEL